MRLLLSTTLFLWSLYSIGQTNSNFITKQKAIDDLKIFETSLREIHPNIYRYTPKFEFDKSLENAKNSIKDTISVNQFYNLVAAIIERVHCGHTFGITSFTDDKRGLLPLDIKILNDKIFVFRNFSTSTELQPGSEILTINGISANDLLLDFRKKSIADGYGLTFKDRTIERDFKWKYATFINQPDSFKITFKDNQSEAEKNLSLRAVSNDLINQKVKRLELPVEKPLDCFVDTKNNVAVLKLKSFMAQSIKKQSGQNLKRTIKRSFKEISKSEVDNLIIDIRWNLGGKAYAPPLLFSYVTDKSFKFKRKLIFRHGYKFTYPEFLNRNKFDDWVNRKLDKRINDSTFEWTHHPNTRKTYKEKTNSFLGNLYIVINGMTASGGAEFASLADANGRGVFVGEETGGDYNGVNGGERTYLVLPNSKIGVLIAGRRNVMAWDEIKNIGHGVPPNHEVRPTIEDLLTGQDPEIKFIYELIKK